MIGLNMIKKSKLKTMGIFKNDLLLIKLEAKDPTGGKMTLSEAVEKFTIRN